MTYTLLWGPTKLSADEIPDLTQDEVREVTIKAASLCDGATISGTPTATSDTLTIGAVTKSGTSFSFTVTAADTGTHHITLTLVTSNGETAKAYLRVKVICEPDDCSSGCDYGRCC